MKSSATAGPSVLASHRREVMPSTEMAQKGLLGEVDLVPLTVPAGWHFGTLGLAVAKWERETRLN